jgi:hypothetical protein
MSGQVVLAGRYWSGGLDITGLVGTGRDMSVHVWTSLDMS